MKYGLHQKAIDHLRRVFTLDAENVEARERLKDIFLSQNREQEAEVELLRLAELVAPSDPDRAELYLQELLAMYGTHTGAYDLARRFRLRVARMSSASADIEVSPDYGGISLTDGEHGEHDELDGAARARVLRPGAGRQLGPADSTPGFDPGLDRRVRSRRADRRDRARQPGAGPAAAPSQRRLPARARQLRARLRAVAVAGDPPDVARDRRGARRGAGRRSRWRRP